MIEIEHAREADRVTIRVAGHLTGTDYDHALPELEQAIENAGGRLDALIRLEDLAGIDFAALWRDLKFDLRHYNDFRRIAVVADSGPVAALSGLAGLVTGAEIRRFAPDEEDAARRWLRDGTLPA